MPIKWKQTLSISYNVIIQNGITAKHLTYHEVLFCRDMYIAAAVVDSLTP